jgi:hypothetical protein
LIGQILGDANGGKGFVNRVRGAAKEPDLLPGHHGNRASFKAGEIRKCGSTRTEKFILLPQNSPNGGPAGSGKIESSCDLPDALQIGLVLKKGADAFVGSQIVTQQFGLVR